MSTYIFLTFGDRTVMVAKPATYQDLKREIRKQFPFLSSVFSVVILFKPSTESAALLSNWVEVDPSAYNAVHSGASVFINVAEPITKRYMFPFPDGRNSNVGPAKQNRHTGGNNTHINTCGVLLDAQVSNENTKASKSKYIYPDSEPSTKLERSDGAACASGWAGVSEKFRRSAKLIPNLKDCKEAVGLEVGESNCYPDEEEDADNNLGQLQEEEKELIPGLSEKGWYTGTEDFVHGNENAGGASRDDYDRYATVQTADDGFSNDDGQHGDNNPNNAGKSTSIPNEKKSMWASLPLVRIRATGESGHPIDDSAPGEDLSWGARYHRHLRNNPITPFSKAESHWSSGEGAQNEFRGFYLRPSDYVEKAPCGSPGIPDAELLNMGPGGWEYNGTHNEKDNANQRHSYTAYAYDVNEFTPTTRTAPAAPNSNGLANQVSQKAQGHPHNYGGSDWSPIRRQYDGNRQPQHRQPQAQPEFSHSPPPFYPSPPYGHSSPPGPGRYTTGSPVAKFVRSSHLPYSNEADQKKRARANAGNHPQAQVQTDNGYDSNEQKYDFQNHFDKNRGNDGLDGGEVYRRRAEGEYGHEQHLRNNVEDFWYAPPENATKAVGGGGTLKQVGRGVQNQKMTTDVFSQESHAGRKVNNSMGWDEPVSNMGWGEQVTYRTGKW